MKLLYIAKRNGCKMFIDELSSYFDVRTYFFNESIENIRKVYKEFTPDITLIHYNKKIYNRNFFEFIKDSYNIYWRNDERMPPEPWYEEMTSVKLFLTSSEDSANAVRKMGKDAEYLIMGYQPTELQGAVRDKDIVFTGQNSHDLFPLSHIRRSIVAKLMQYYPNFYCYGSGWGIHEPIHWSVYNEAKIGVAVNHYNTSKTYSNRMYQIIECGALCLCYKTKDIEKVFGDNVVYWESWGELKEKIDYYLSHEPERKKITERAKLFIADNHTWKHKAQYIINLLKQRGICM